MNFLLDISQNDYGNNLMSQYGFGETALFGLQVVLMGMATVFAVLIVIWLALVIFKFLLYDVRNTKIKNESKPAVTINEPIIRASNAEDEVVAVIAAAIAMAESESTEGIKFRVVSFKKR